MASTTLAAAILGGAFASPAKAQTDEQRSAARAAAIDGLQAMAEGRYKDALDLCTRAESLMHAPTHLLLIARAQAKLGHLVEAQEAYIKIERETLAPDAPHAFVEAQRTAAEEDAALAPRVPTLKIDVDGATAKQAKVTLDGSVLEPALVGLAMPIDPGTYTLKASSPDEQAAPVTVTIAEGAKQSIRLSLEPIVAPPPEAEAPPAPAGGGDAAQAPSSSHGHGGLRAAGWVGAGLGAAGLVLGTVFVVENRSERSDADALCAGPGGECPGSQKPKIDSADASANTDATLAWIGYGVGVAGVVAGVALLWASGGSSDGAPSPAAGKVVPWISPRAAGVRVVF